MKAFAQAVGAGVVALMVLFPRTTHAEAVEDFERAGEYDEDGQRFGSVVVKGVLMLSANAPGGWSLVRTYENKSDDAVDIALEERVQSTESMMGARVTPPAMTELSRTQKLHLGPNERKTIGTFLPEALGTAMTKAKRTQALASAKLEAGKWDGDVTFRVYDVQYLQALGPGQTAAVHEREKDEYVPTKPERLPAPNIERSKAKSARIARGLDF